MTILDDRRRPSRRPQPALDLTPFAGDIEQALNAFGSDVSYAVTMARAAVNINRKRTMWQDRKDKRAPSL